MEVRPIAISDLHSFYALFCEVSAEGRFSARSTPPPIEAVERALAQVAKNNWPVYVIEQEHQIVGSAEAYPESFCRAGGSNYTGILGMQVRADYRRRGYGVALLSAVITHCREQGFSAIDLSVLKSNTAARSLYEKAGFAWVEDLPVCTLASGVTDQPVKMRLVL